jgi:hypothetical protein
LRLLVDFARNWIGLLGRLVTIVPIVTHETS